MNIDPNKLIWIEHYPEKNRKETFDLVEFELKGTQFSNPKWRTIKKSDLTNYGVDYEESIKDQWQA